MRIGLNLLHALPEIGGGWNYIENLVAAIGDYDQKNIYIAFVTEHSKCLVPKRPNIIQLNVKINPFIRIERILCENIYLPIISQKYRIDCIHWFANTIALINFVPGIVSIYDLLAYRIGSSFKLIKRIYLRKMISLAVRRAKFLLPMSESTGLDLKTILHADPNKVVVIPCILKNEFVPIIDNSIKDFRNRYQLPDYFLLYVAHFYPHKNHARLLHAYRELKLSGYKSWPLVLRGDSKDLKSYLLRIISRYELSNDVIFLPRLLHKEMPLLYSSATALIFPSLFEGGGIPIVEAMGCGCPVVGSDIAAVKEYAGDAALYFNAKDIISIGRAMQKIQLDPNLRESLRKIGLDRANNFRANFVVNKLLEVYSRAIKSN